MKAVAIPRNQLTRRDVIVGSIIALVMAITFALLSSGKSLLVTFVPGVVLTWLVYVWMFAKRVPLPSGSAFLPPFFALLAVQFLHFGEEFATGFRIRFPQMYGGSAYSDETFVWVNMLAYFAFALGCILSITRNVRFLLVPALFFIIYGAIGNAIAHTWWSAYLGSYFPGLVTAQIFWIAGPWVLYKLLGSRKAVLVTIATFAGVLFFLLTAFATPGWSR